MFHDFYVEDNKVLRIIRRLWIEVIALQEFDFQCFSLFGRFTRFILNVYNTIVA
jgi:hypothetical protein